MKLLSIIIPVYNVEKYIDDTLKSIIEQRQDLFDYEVIVVDDGSPDNSMAIVDKYVDRLPMVIIHQKNRGLSGARNTGIKNAHSKYLWFVDSDDVIAPGIFKNLSHILDDTSVDVYGLNILSIQETGNSFLEYPCANPKLRDYFYDRTTDWKELGKYMALGISPRYLYRREFLLSNDLLFKEGIIFEDIEFNVKVKCLAQTICFKNIISYHYLRRDSGSIMSSLDMKAVYSTVAIIESFDRFKQKWHWYDGRYSIVCRNSFTHICALLSMQNKIEQDEYKLFYRKNRWRFTFKGLYYFLLGLRHLSKIDLFKVLNLIIQPSRNDKEL